MKKKGTMNASSGGQGVTFVKTTHGLLSSVPNLAENGSQPHQKGKSYHAEGARRL